MFKTDGVQELVNNRSKGFAPHPQRQKLLVTNSSPMRVAAERIITQVKNYRMDNESMDGMDMNSINGCDKLDMITENQKLPNR